MGGGVKTQTPGFGINFFVGFGRKELFRAAHADPNDTQITQLVGLCQSRQRFFRTVIPDHIDDQGNLDLRNASKAYANGFGQALEAEAAPEEIRG